MTTRSLGRLLLSLSLLLLAASFWPSTSSTKTKIDPSQMRFPANQIALGTGSSTLGSTDNLQYVGNGLAISIDHQSSSCSMDVFMPAGQGEFSCSDASGKEAQWGFDSTNHFIQTDNEGGFGLSGFVVHVDTGVTDWKGFTSGLISATPSATGSTLTFNKPIIATTFQSVKGVFSSLPACAAGTEGTTAAVTDSTTNTWGATITGTGANHVLAYCDGSVWTVAGK